jgi:hypothetical protein
LFYFYFFFFVWVWVCFTGFVFWVYRSAGGLDVLICGIVEF